MDTIEAFVGIKCTMLLIIYLANSYVTANLLYIENREQNTSGLSVVTVIMCNCATNTLRLDYLCYPCR